MLDQRPRATPELVAGYMAAAVLATKRSEECAVGDRKAEAPLWLRLAQYCTDMATIRATDDDQFPSQRSRMRHRKEVPMTSEEMDEKGLFIVGALSKPLPEWQWAAMELAMGYLSPLQRVCFEMHKAGGLSYREIGEALNMSKGQVQNAVFRARQIFSSEVQPKLSHIFGNER